MKILITGGTVFVSKFIAEYFADAGHTVYVLNRNTKPQLHGVIVIECDRENIGDRLDGLLFDLVIDATAFNSARNGLMPSIRAIQTKQKSSKTQGLF